MIRSEPCSGAETYEMLIKNYGLSDNDMKKLYLKAAYYRNSVIPEFKKIKQISKCSVSNMLELRQRFTKRITKEEIIKLLDIITEYTFNLPTAGDGSPISGIIHSISRGDEYQLGLTHEKELEAQGIFIDYRKLNDVQNSCISEEEYEYREYISSYDEDEDFSDILNATRDNAEYMNALESILKEELTTFVTDPIYNEGNINNEDLKNFCIYGHLNMKEDSECYYFYHLDVNRGITDYINIDKLYKASNIRFWDFCPKVLNEFTAINIIGLDHNHRYNELEMYLGNKRISLNNELYTGRDKLNILCGKDIKEKHRDKLTMDKYEDYNIIYVPGNTINDISGYMYNNNIPRAKK